MGTQGRGLLGVPSPGRIASVAEEVESAGAWARETAGMAHALAVMPLAPRATLPTAAAAVAAAAVGVAALVGVRTRHARRVEPHISSA